MASTVDIMNLTHGWVFWLFSTLLTDSKRKAEGERHLLNTESNQRPLSPKPIACFVAWCFTLKLIQSTTHFFYLPHFTRLSCWLLEELTVRCSILSCTDYTRRCHILAKLNSQRSQLRTGDNYGDRRIAYSKIVSGLHHSKGEIIKGVWAHHNGLR